MKKLLAITLMIILLISSASVYAEDYKWFKSSDGVVEVKFVSLEESNYPEYRLKLKVRIVGETKEETLISYYDLSSWVTSFVKKNPSYSNRKVKVTSDGTFDSFKQESGTIYKIEINTAVGGENDYILIKKLDLSDTFPDDFVNYDIINIAACIKAHVGLLLNASSYSISDPAVMISKKYENIVYYFYDITAQNRMGGNSTNMIFVIFNTATGKYDSFNLTTDDFVVKNGSGLALGNALVEMMDLDYDAHFSVDSIMAKLK